LVKEIDTREGGIKFGGMMKLQDSDEEGHPLMSQQSFEENIEFVADSGCSDHMLRNTNGMTNIHMQSKKIIMANRQSLESNQIGDLTPYLFIGNCREPLLPKNVLVVPLLVKPLLLLKLVVGDGVEIKMSTKSITFLYCGRVIGKAILKRNIYGIELSYGISAAALALGEDILKWHVKFCHASSGKLKKLSGIHPEMPKHFPDVIKCTSYVIANCHRKPYPESKTKYQEPLELLSAYLCGPFSTRSIEGVVYMLVVVDYFSRYMKVSFLRNKDKDLVVPALSECIESLEKEINKLVKRIRTDGDTEFVTGDMAGFNKRKRIKHQVAVRDSPQTNGQVKR
jgi:hypothetical protein